MENLQSSEVYDHMQDTSPKGYRRDQDDMRWLCTVILLTALALGLVIKFLT